MTFEHRLKKMREWYYENQLKIPKMMRTVSYAKDYVKFIGLYILSIKNGRLSN